MYFSRRCKYFLLGLLILLNFLIRIPSIPHERGSPDEFTMHNLANSVSAFGYAKWWAHPASIFGFYPYSYASATAFIYSGISQSTGISMDWIAWIFPAILGVFIVLSVYILAGLIKNDDVFKFLAAFVVSLSPGVLNYITWQISARGLFIALLPFFLYLLLKSHASRYAVRFGVLTFILFILIMATHHYYILSVPFIFSYILIIIFYKIKSPIKISDNLVSIALLAGFLGMFSIPFFTGLFIESSRYSALQTMLSNNIRYLGPFIFFAVGGFSYLILKRNREFGEWFLILSLIFFSPFLYIDKYAQFISNILLGLFMSIGIVNLKESNFDKKRVFSMIIIILLLFVSFSAFYQHWRTNVGRQPINQFYMEDTTYNGALWIKNNIEAKRLIGNDDQVSTRIFAVSEVPTLVMPETDLTYGFFNASNIKTIMNSPFSVEFYLHNPYITPNFYTETESALWNLNSLDIDNDHAKLITSTFNLSYFIENSFFSRFFSDNELILSLEKKRELIFSNGRIRIWCLDESCL